MAVSPTPGVRLLKKISIESHVSELKKLRASLLLRAFRFGKASVLDAVASLQTLPNIMCPKIMRSILGDMGNSHEIGFN